MGFTTEQQSVIDARNSNVLVSAAAGSGKTTVLVERIIRRITGDNPIDIDKLLVVTFTKAAAAQMKEKILIAIQKKLEEDPTNEHLQRQETLVHGAQITTIDSFCQYIIRNNFNDIELDPSYRVGDEGEMRLIKADVMEELLEEKYEEADPDFLRCMEYFASDSTDKDVEDFIIKLYDYAMSMPFPEDWLKERASDYVLDTEKFDASDMVKKCSFVAKTVLEECLDRIKAALAIAEEPDGPNKYGETLEEDLEAIETALGKEYKDYDELRSAVLNITFGKLKQCRDKSVNADKKVLVSDSRKKIKGKIDDLADKYFAEDKETILSRMELAKEPVRVLTELAVSFKHRFDEKKRDKGIIDFGDMEHLALQIILNGGAAQYKDYFEEVMIDEYQDSNEVQDRLLSSVSGESEGVYNRFMVGDVKQSIYKFRLARPEIFMDKMGVYSTEEGADCRKISLHNNFRSRPEVLDGVNYIFEQIMGQDLGKVAYDEDARLIPGGTFPEGGSFATELMLADVEGKTSSAAREIEAQMLAHRIRELMESGVVSGSDNTLRKVRYSDIVILLRSTKGWDEVFRKTLESRGIPTYVESRTGYFSATEVVTILNLLRILDNPRQDIPLVSVMHSPIGGFTDEDMALIKAHDKTVEKSKFDSGFFYDIMMRCINPLKGDGLDRDELDTDIAGADVTEPENGCGNKYISDKLELKIREFTALINELREMAGYLPVNELIRSILDMTHYDEYCAALPGGNKRLANLSMLMEKAEEYENTSFKGVFHFVRYIEQLGKYEVDYGEANILDENADVVRIMSIHKSKGLEFPIVFLAGMSKKFNYMDTTQPVVLDMDMGIGTYALDLDRRVKYKTLRKNLMDEFMKMDILGEEMRILYVAMTRAKDKLIMTGQITVPEPEKAISSGLGAALQNYMRFRNREGLGGDQPYLLPYYLRSSAGSYQDLVLMALARHPVYENICSAIGIECKPLKVQSDAVPFEFRIMNEEELTADEIGRDVLASVRLQRLGDPLAEDDDGFVSLFKDRFESSYAFGNYDGLFVKTTVTELKKAQLHEKDEPSHELYGEAEVVPTFLGTKEEKAKGAARGTIYHRVMELLYSDGDEDLDERAGDLQAFMHRMEEEGRMPAGSSESVGEKDILAFYNSETGKRMKKAYDSHRLHRESPFMLGIDADRLNPQFPKEEKVLIQGIIDVWFEEDDGIVLLDYKTDKVSKGSELVDKYSVQLDYYKEALERITEKKVKERIIYSFTLGETINL